MTASGFWPFHGHGHYSLPMWPRYALNTKCHNNSCWRLISTSILVLTYGLLCKPMMHRPTKIKQRERVTAIQRIFPTCFQEDVFVAILLKISGSNCTVKIRGKMGKMSEWSFRVLPMTLPLIYFGRGPFSGLRNRHQVVNKGQQHYIRPSTSIQRHKNGSIKRRVAHSA